MRFRLKAALKAVFAIFPLAATVASGVSMADESVPSVATGHVATVSGSATNSDGVIFAGSREIVQPLPSDQANKPAGDAEGMIAVPEGSYDSLAALVRATDSDAPADADTRCLATAIFYESRSESLEGQLAVARVIINRAHSSRFADSSCGVVRQPGQFSFVRHGVLPQPNEAKPAWKTAIAIARIALSNAWASPAEGALFFHARRASFASARQRVAVIDNHIFYR